MSWVGIGPSLKLYRLGGITVRIHWSFLILGAFLLIPGYRDGYLQLATALWAFVFCTILLHEYGHACTARLLGAGSEEIVLWALGGLAVCGQGPTALKDVAVAVAGPLVNVLFMGVLLFPIASRGYEIDWDLLNPWGQNYGDFWILAYKWNIALLAFNLLIPAFPLDGGRIFTGIIARKIGLRRALLFTLPVAMIIGCVLLTLALMEHEIFSALVCLWIISEAFQVYRNARLGTIEEYDANAWRRSLHEESHRPGFFARWRKKRARSGNIPGQEAASQVDIILDKIKREGMQALTDNERKILQREANRLSNE